MILKVNIYSINNTIYRLHFTHKIYILNNYITIGYHFSSQYCYYVVSSFSDYCYVNILLIASKDNKKLANQRILSRYLTENAKYGGQEGVFTPSSMGKKMPLLDIKSASNTTHFLTKIQHEKGIKMQNRTTYQLTKVT